VPIRISASTVGDGIQVEFTCFADNKLPRGGECFLSKFTKYCYGILICEYSTPSKLLYTNCYEFFMELQSVFSFTIGSNKVKYLEFRTLPKAIKEKFKKEDLGNSIMKYDVMSDALTEIC
jgi:hypothetical protein